jgi:hypothetical protein
MFEVLSDSHLIIDATNDTRRPQILVYEVNDMPEHKMVERKKETGIGKESTEMSEEKDTPNSKDARKGSKFMEEERQGSKTVERGKAPHEGAKDVSHGKGDIKDTRKKLEEEGKDVSGKSHEGSKEDVSSGGSKTSEKAGTKHR